MSIFEELKISLLKPQQYYKFKGQPIKKLLIFDVIITVLGSIYLVLSTLLKGLFTGSLSTYIDYYSKASLFQIIYTLIYMWFGLITTSLLFALMFRAFCYIKKVKDFSFKDAFNYSTHTLTVCIVLGAYFGGFVVLFAFGYFAVAINGNKYLLQPGGMNNEN